MPVAGLFCPAVRCESLKKFDVILSAYTCLSLPFVSARNGQYLCQCVGSTWSTLKVASGTFQPQTVCNWFKSSNQHAV
jgi:hypothetical protein